ncbi:histidine phosphatase family protein [Granulicella sp. S190]|uniref:histidine phosphatase family protein n=1 Tax=Granulicella sp. S190 TaxID=1747226 RepID=UPI00131ABE60|nr:histidine phosphatase family protein [Granulicella sp. S190]
MPSRVTFISHAPTSAQRLSAFPVDEPVEESALFKLMAFHYPSPRFQQMFSAPERRTQQTAEALNLITSPTDELRDVDFGSWRGRTLTDLHNEEPDGVVTWLTDPTAIPHGGESVAAFVRRIAAWLPSAGPGHTLAITHPAVIRAAVLHTLDAPLQAFWRIDIAPLTVTDLRYNGRMWTLRSMALPLSPGFKGEESVHTD